MTGSSTLGIKTVSAAGATVKDVVGLLQGR